MSKLVFNGLFQQLWTVDQTRMDNNDALGVILATDCGSECIYACDKPDLRRGQVVGLNQ